MYKKLFVLLAALAMPLDGFGDGALDRATLRGLKAVNLAIDPVAPEIEKEGATVSVLQARLDQKLRDGGISIDSSAIEFVGLRLTSVRAGRGPVAISAAISLYQPVLLARNHDVKTATQTWGADTMVLADTKQVYRACMDSVDELAGRFVTAYRSVNPETGSRDHEHRQ